MVKIYQTRFGGIDKPVEEQGNCFQACLASILEIPLEKAFDCIPFDTLQDGLLETEPWYLAFNEWLSQFGLASIYLSYSPVIPAVSSLLGYHIAEVKSSVLKNGETHAVVIHNGDLIHDPNPNSKVNSDDLVGIYFIVPLDAGKRCCQEVMDFNA